MSKPLAYRSGSWLGVVRSSTVLILSQATPPAMVRSLWEFLGSAPDITDILNRVTSGFGTNLTGMPAFAIITLNKGSNAVLRGDMDLTVVSAEGAESVISGRNMTTWTERAVGEFSSLDLVIGAAPAGSVLLPLTEGVVLLGGLVIGSNAEPIGQHGATHHDQSSSNEAQPIAVDAPAKMTEVGAAEPVQADSVQAQPVQAEPVQADSVQAEPLTADSGLPEPELADGLEAEPHSKTVVYQEESADDVSDSDDDASLDSSAASEASAAEDAPALSDQGEVDAAEQGEAEHGGKPSDVDHPGTDQLGTDQLGTEHPGTPASQGQGRRAAAVYVDDSPIADPLDATGSYDHLWEKTINRSVEDAAIRNDGPEADHAPSVDEPAAHVNDDAGHDPAVSEPNEGAGAEASQSNSSASASISDAGPSQLAQAGNPSHSHLAPSIPSGPQGISLISSVPGFGPAADSHNAGGAGQAQPLQGQATYGQAGLSQGAPNSAPYGQEQSGQQQSGQAAYGQPGQNGPQPTFNNPAHGVAEQNGAAHTGGDQGNAAQGNLAQGNLHQKNPAQASPTQTSPTQASPAQANPTQGGVAQNTAAHGGAGGSGVEAPSGQQAHRAQRVMVLARMCARGHANPTNFPRCAHCGEPVFGEPLQVVRPTLGQVRLSSGDLIPLDQSLVIGRQPSASKATSSDDVRLVPVASQVGDLSRSHVEVRLDGWDVSLVDLKATNGTIVYREGQAPRRLGQGEQFPVRDGDIAELGEDVSIRFEGLL